MYDFIMRFLSVVLFTVGMFGILLHKVTNEEAILNTLVALFMYTIHLPINKEK